MMKNKIKIAVFTGSRAEYGLLRQLIGRLKQVAEYDVKLIVSGSHLSRSHGYTLNEIRDDGYLDYEIVELSLNDENGEKMDFLAGEALMGVGRILRRENRKYLVVLGDRYEAFGAAAAAHLVGTEVIHLHGGESTLGAVDDRLRHAITQLSSWHFTAADRYQRKVMRMVDDPKKVFNVGPMVIDSLVQVKPIDRNEFEMDTGYSFGRANLLVTYHPETILVDKGISGFISLLEAISQCGCKTLFTYPNADEGGDVFLKHLKDYVHSNPDRCQAIPSLGQTRYLQALMLFEAVAGNSSSGIIEAPLVGTPVLNIGQRQEGRIRHGNVTDVNAVYDEILNGLRSVLRQGYVEEWPRTIKSKLKSPAETIVSTLQEVLD